MRLRYAVIAGLAFSWAAPAAAQMVSAKDPRTVVAALQAKGYKAELGTAGGEPSIKSGAGGVQFSIFFNNCTNGAACTTVSFVTGFTDIDATLAEINQWNAKNRFAHAYIDAEQDPVLRMDVDLDHQGIPRANFGEYVDIWGSLAPKFLNYLRQ
ncbi:MAG TPA: YbjN domain-containing protein [Allosphingosinicella sp.]|nr:YbjN domain-containing protein [Allosphingosinicella sp.]